MGMRANESVLVVNVPMCFGLLPLFVPVWLMNSPVDRIHQIVGTVVVTLCGAQVIGGNDLDVEVTALRADVAL